MLEIEALMINIFLITIIFLRLPESSVGFANLTSKSNLFGSPASSQRLLNIVTAMGIFVYFAIAFEFDLGMN